MAYHVQCSRDMFNTSKKKKYSVQHHHSGSKEASPFIPTTPPCICTFNASLQVRRRDKELWMSKTRRKMHWTWPAAAAWGIENLLHHVRLHWCTMREGQDQIKAAELKWSNASNIRRICPQNGSKRFSYNDTPKNKKRHFWCSFIDVSSPRLMADVWRN